MLGQGGQKPNSFEILYVIFIVLRLEVSLWISYTTVEEIWFTMRFSSFLLYSVHSLNCKRLREFEEIEISRQS
jgi:hypothetical protein